VEHLTRCEGRRSSLSTLLAAGTVELIRSRTCTLLGPEGPDALVLRDGPDEPQDLFLCRQRRRRGRYRPYFENYTVDASIFELIFGSAHIDDLKDH
jgi:hypothetical protein